MFGNNPRNSAMRRVNGFVLVVAAGCLHYVKKTQVNKRFNLETIKELAKQDSPVIPQSLRQLFKEPLSTYTQDSILSRYLKHEESSQLINQLNKIKADSDQQKKEYLRVQRRETLAYFKFLKSLQNND